MKNSIFIITALVALCVSIIEACKKPDVIVTTPVDFAVPKGWPSTQYNFQTNPLTEEGIALGKKLFYDGRLSKDGAYPCSSCHQQNAAFGTFDHDRSHGYNHSHTLRNAPSLQNLAWQYLFNADGSANTLEQVTLDHITSSTDMGETVDGVVNKLQSDGTYRAMFKAAFGDQNINAARLSKAISQFLLTMVSSNSKYDRVEGGLETFTPAEQTGYDLFKAKCGSCHVEPLFTDLSFRNTGISVDPNTRDFGRFRATRNPLDSLKFKVPGLRNIDKTFPYAHDGRFLGLDNMLEHYRSEVVVSSTTDPFVRNKIPMSNFEFGQLKAFMSTLTDTAFLNNRKFKE